MKKFLFLILYLFNNNCIFTPIIRADRMKLAHGEELNKLIKAESKSCITSILFPINYHIIVKEFLSKYEKIYDMEINYEVDQISIPAITGLVPISNKKCFTLKAFVNTSIK